MPIRSRFPSFCPACLEPILTGATIDRVDGGWGHLDCAQAQRRRRLIDAGETFRSRAPSSYRRGSSPGSYRAPKTG